MATIADIILEQGRSRANARRQEGNLKAGMWTSLADIVGGTIGQIQKDREEAPIRAQEAELRGLQLDRARAGQRIAANFKHLLSLDQPPTEAQIMEASADDPSQGIALIRELRSLEIDPMDQEEKKLRIRKLQQEIDQAALPKTEKLETVDTEGNVVTEFVVPEPGKSYPKPPDKLTYGGAHYEMVNGRRMLVRDASDGTVRDLKGNVLSGESIQPVPPAPGQSSPTYQAKEVLGNDDKPVMANYDAKTGKWIGPDGQPITNPRPVPSAMETQDARKFKQAAPILSAVSELSEKINTAQGVIAKLKGGVEKAKAQANYNDDVAEYEALISGFTPLVARALGHTGVLTQQDVDSVKALFPRPGDSKSLRDRKIERIKTIIGTLESNANPIQPNAPAPAAGVGRVYYDMNGNPVSEAANPVSR